MPTTPEPDRQPITRPVVETYATLASADGWLTNAQLADQLAARQVAARTVRAATLQLVRAGVVEQAELFPPRFRPAPKLSRDGRAYLGRLQRAADALGVALPEGAR